MLCDLIVIQTREEKKLEAIVKAFERMERREQHQRKKEAQLEQSRGRPKDKDSGGTVKSDRDSGRSDTATSNSSQKVTKQHSLVRQPSFCVSFRVANSSCIMYTCDEHVN